MPKVIVSTDFTTGHCWPPTTGLAVAHAENIVIEGRAHIVVITDIFIAHPGPCGISPTHPVPVTVGSPTVFANGLAVLRDLDPLGCGDIAKSLANSVFTEGP
jgi:hypothetical protein